MHREIKETIPPKRKKRGQRTVRSKLLFSGTNVKITKSLQPSMISISIPIYSFFVLFFFFLAFFCIVHFKDRYCKNIYTLWRECPIKALSAYPGHRHHIAEMLKSPVNSDTLCCVQNFSASIQTPQAQRIMEGIISNPRQKLMMPCSQRYSMLILAVSWTLTPSWREAISQFVPLPGELEPDWGHPWIFHHAVYLIQFVFYNWLWQIFVANGQAPWNFSTKCALYLMPIK